uniref:Uncharacterized protein n=1 Tax=Rhizophora mucronata TaxID=61149 RepID=A0A2P2LR07_RHIMU
MVHFHHLIYRKIIHFIHKIRQ